MYSCQSALLIWCLVVDSVCSKQERSSGKLAPAKQRGTAGEILNLVPQLQKHAIMSKLQKYNFESIRLFWDRWFLIPKPGGKR